MLSYSFPGGTSGKEPPANARNRRNAGLIPGLGRSPGGGHGTPLQYSCLENPMDRGAWRLQSIGSQSWTWLSDFHLQPLLQGYPGSTDCKEVTCQCRRHKRLGFNPRVGKIPWRRAWQPTPEFLPGESHGQRSLMGYRSVYRVTKSGTHLNWLSKQA